MENEVNSKIKALQDEGFHYKEYDIVKNTILLMNEKGLKTYIFGWLINNDTLSKLIDNGFECSRHADVLGEYTSIKWCE